MIAEAEKRTGHAGRDQRHDYQHGKYARRKNSEIVAEVQRNQLHQAARIHQRPSANESIQLIPVSRAVTIAPPSLPSVAMKMRPRQISQLLVSFSKPICVRSPVNAKSSGSRKTELKFSSRSLRNSPETRRAP